MTPLGHQPDPFIRCGVQFVQAAKFGLTALCHSRKIVGWWLWESVRCVRTFQGEIDTLNSMLHFTPYFEGSIYQNGIGVFGELGNSFFSLNRIADR